MKRAALVLVALAVVGTACGDGSDEPASTPPTTTAAPPSTTAAPPTTTAAGQDSPPDTPPPPPDDSGDAPTTVAAADEGGSSDLTASSSFIAEVWADNWFALYVNGEYVGEDSVPITTERSFNSETLSFQADYPLAVAIEAKDFKETDSGLEYIGTDRQQMGDGGIIAQITDTSTGEVVLVTNSGWSALVIHQAPLNKDCEKSGDPDSACESVITSAPDGWTESGFDDGGWSSATVWSEADVSPKDGYNQINWDGDAELIWGSDLETDNTVLLRATTG